MARDFFDDFDQRLRDVSSRVVLSWGIGLADHPGNRFHHAYRQAHEALNIGYGLAGPATVHLLQQHANLPDPAARRPSSGQLDASMTSVMASWCPPWTRSFVRGAT